MRLLTIIAVGTLLIAAVQAQSIVDRQQFYAGDIFTVTCDFAKFTNVPANYLQMMSIYRKTSTDRNFTNIAIFQPFLPPPNRTINNPGGRQWDVQFLGNADANNKNTLRIVWTVKDSKCGDAGLYQCWTTADIGSLYISAPFNLTALAQVSQDDISVTPHNGDDSYFSSYDLEDNENITITLTCSFRGPVNLKAVWRFSKDSNEQNYLPINDIVDETPETTTRAGCTFSSYRSTLSFQLQEDHNGTTYFCTVVENNVEMSRAKFTIGILSTISDCPSGLWGSHCEHTCENKCYGTSCNQVNGECNEGCLGYDDPPNCNSSCRSGFYGRNCSSSCSNTCVDKLCDHVNGQCSFVNNGGTLIIYFYLCYFSVLIYICINF